VKCGDGSFGWAENAPYDAILVTAAAPRFPESLKAQLAEGGRMVAPVASGIFGETLTCMTKLAGNGFVEEAVGDVCFVPLIGEEGYGENEPWEDRAAELVLLLF
jgi:protein-L-isoaspartate(D-aspartate) O-methyltransferase